MSTRLRDRPEARLALGLAVLAVVLGGFVLARVGLTATARWAEHVAELARQSGPAGLAVFIVAQTVVALVGIVPASLLGITAGAVFGLGLGFGVAAAGTLIGGWIAFRLARSLLRPWIERRLQSRPGSRWAELDRAVQRDGWRFVCLLRISPIMPFAITSYALGLTQVRAADYLLGTLAALPALLGYVAVGALAGEGVAAVSQGGSPLRLALIGIGVLATGLLIWRSGKLLAACGFLPGAVNRIRLPRMRPDTLRLVLPLAFLATAVPLAITLAVLTPPGQVADESAHVFRVQALLDGHIAGYRGRAVARDGSVRVAAGVKVDVGSVHAAFLPIPGPVRAISGADWMARRAVEWTGTRIFVEISPLAIYAPVFYVPGAIGLGTAKALGASPFQALTAGRLVNALSFAIMGFLALLATRRGQALLFCVLSVPMTVSLGASMNQDGQIIAMAALGVALLTIPRRPGRDVAFWAGILALAAVALVKIPYAGLAVLALLPLAGEGSRPWRTRLAAVAVIALPSLAWTAYVLARISAPSYLPDYTPGPLWPYDPTTVFHGPDARAQLQVLLAQPTRIVTLVVDTIAGDVWLLQQMVGVLGWLDLPLQDWLYVAWAVAVVAAIGSDVLARQPATRVGPTGIALCWLAAACVVIGIYQSQYLGWSQVGAPRIEGPSGRYWLPVIPLLALALPRLLAGPVPLRLALMAMPVVVAAAGLVAIPPLLMVTYFIR